MIKIEITANNEVEYKEALTILGVAFGGQSVTPTKKVDTKEVKTEVPEKKDLASGGKDPQTSSTTTDEIITQETAKKTRYFLYKTENKTLTIAKGKGIPVEAIAAGDAVEMTKAEHDKFNKKEAPKEESVEKEEVPKSVVMELVKKGADLKLHEQIKTVFAEVDSANGKFGGVDPSRYAELKDKLEEIIAEAE